MGTMRATPIRVVKATILGILLTAFAAPASAQSMYGRITDAGSGDLLDGVELALLEQDAMEVVARAVSDSTGTYTLDVSEPGSYQLVASHPEFAVMAPRPVELDRAGRERMDVELVRLGDLARATENARRLAESAERACQGQLDERASAVMGVVRDSVADVTLSGVSVVLEQITRDGRLRAVREVTTDGDGFFAFCPLPAPQEVAVRADLGERSAMMGLQTEPGTGTFLNLRVGLSTQSEASAILGEVVDFTSGEPITGAQVELVGDDRSVTTDVDGRFVFPDLDYGVYLVEVSNLGYSTARKAFYLNGGATATIDVALSVEAIEIDPITVTVDRGNQIFGDLAEFDERMSRGFGLFLTAEDLERQGVGPASPLYSALRGLPSVRIRKGEGMYYSVQLRSAVTLSGGACEPTLWVDGMRYRLDPGLGWAEPIGAIQAVEVYRGAAEVPGEFSGTDASCGVVVVWTKRGR